MREDLLDKTAGLLEEIPCYGRCADSVADCLRKNPPHPTAGRLARDVLYLVANKSSRETIDQWIAARKQMAHPDEVHSLNLDGLVPLGKKDAPVVIVEFSDFQCPFCAKVAPMLEQVVRESKGKARLYFKQFPIKSHPRALAASKACVASEAFGKFWEYCSALFAKDADLSDEGLLALARQEGIDPVKFKAEMEKDEVLNRIADEKLAGLKHRITGTPSIFINGKKFLLQPSPDLLRDRIEEELDILNGRD